VDASFESAAANPSVMIATMVSTVMVTAVVCPRR